MLTADNPHAPANIVRYNFKEQTFKQVRTYAWKVLPMNKGYEFLCALTHVCMHACMSVHNCACTCTCILRDTVMYTCSGLFSMWYMYSTDLMQLDTLSLASLQLLERSHVWHACSMRVPSEGWYEPLPNLRTCVLRVRAFVLAFVYMQYRAVD